MCVCVCVCVAEMQITNVLIDGLPVDCGVGNGVYVFVCMHIYMHAWVHVCVGGGRGSDADE